MNGVRLKAADTASDSGYVQVTLNNRFMFNEDIQDNDTYVLVVSCRNRSSSRNTYAHLPPVLWRLCHTSKPMVFKKIKLMNEINVLAIK